GTGCRRRPLPRGRRPRRRRRRSAVRPALRARHLLPDHAARPPTGPRRHRRRADGRAARGAWWGRGGGGGVGGAAVAGPVRSPGVAGSPCARRRCARRVRAVVALLVRWTLAPGAAEVTLRAPGRRRRRRPLVPRGRAPAPIVLPGAARSFVARAPGRTRTCNHQLRRLVLYPLSYEGIAGGPRGGDADLKTTAPRGSARACIGTNGRKPAG